jgi:hypothetical protein
MLFFKFVSEGLQHPYQHPDVGGVVRTSVVCLRALCWAWALLVVSEGLQGL